jgi:hypothetical protein
MMHLFKKTALAAILSSSLYSCSTVYQYGPGNLGHESRLLITPGSKDSVRTAHYISGRYSFNLGQGYNEGESSRFADAYYHLGYSARYFSGAIGAGVFGGNYQVRKFSPDPGWKKFYGVNAMGQAALNIPIGPVNWRILGVRAGFSVEDGGLYDFRIKHREIPGFDEFTSNRLTGFAGTCSEIMIRHKDYTFGGSSNLVFLFGQREMLGFASSASLYAGYKEYSLIYQITGSIRQGQNHSLGMIFRFR